jgi:hypothetical protein
LWADQVPGGLHLSAYFTPQKAQLKRLAAICQVASVAHLGDQSFQNSGSCLVPFLGLIFHAWSISSGNAGASRNRVLCFWQEHALKVRMAFREFTEESFSLLWPSEPHGFFRFTANLLIHEPQFALDIFDLVALQRRLEFALKPQGFAHPEYEALEHPESSFVTFLVLGFHDPESRYQILPGRPDRI